LPGDHATPDHATPDQATPDHATPAPAPDCPRTGGLVDRIVAERVTPADRTHAEGCATCGPLLARAASFDDELRRTARRLVSEDLPQGILDPAITDRAPQVRLRREGPGFAGIFAAVGILVLATGIALFPGGLSGPIAGPDASGPPASPPDTGLQLQGPPLYRTPRIGGLLISAEWLCSGGRPLPSPPSGTGPVDHLGITCSSPKSSFATSVVVVTGESADNEVVEVAMTGELLGADIDSARKEIADYMSKATYLAITAEEAASKAGDFVRKRLPELQLLVTGDEVVETFGQVRVVIQRLADGNFVLRLQALPLS
jgi:hypothetical protein